MSPDFHRLPGLLAFVALCLVVVGSMRTQPLSPSMQAPSPARLDRLIPPIPPNGELSKEVWDRPNVLQCDISNALTEHHDQKLLQP